MKRKFLVFLVALLIIALVSQPVMAGTTDSMIGFSLVRSVTDATVKAAAVFYNSKTGSYTVGNYNGNDLTDYTISQFDSYVVTASIDRNYDSGTPYYGIRYNITDLNIDAASTLSLDINGLIFFSNLVSDDSSQSTVWPALLPSTTSPYKAYVTYTWSGSGYMPPKTEEGSGSWISISNQSGTSDVSVTYDNEWFLPADFGSSIMYRPSADYRYSMSFDIPDTYTKNGYTYDVMSASVDSCVVTVVYPYTVNTMYANFDKDLSLYGYDRVNIDGNYMRWYPIFNYSFGNSIATLSTSSGQSVTNQVGGMIGQVNQSIGKLGQSINKGFAEVKNTVKEAGKEVGDKVQSQTDEMKKGFTDIIKGITELPEKIGEMLTDLIVPDQEKVGGKFEEVKQLAEEKLGILYQVPEMVIEMGKAVVSGVSTPQNTMTLPQFDIAVPNEGTFTVWNEYEFEIMPKELDVVKNAIKTITSLICVIATVNAIKRKYESWLNHQ